MEDKDPVLLHGSCVSWMNRGLLILGASGSGKSTLALQLMAYGARLVGDDRIWVARRGDLLIATCPPSICGRIEARGVGILAAEALPEAPLALAVDLDRPEPDRLPDHRRLDLLGIGLPLVLGQGRGHLAPVLLQYLTAGRADGAGA